MGFDFLVPDNWDVEEAQSFCTKVADGTHDSPKKTIEGKLLVTSKNIVGGKLDLSKSYYISDDDYQNINRRSKVDVNDVLLSMIGTVGELCVIKEPPEFAIKNVGLLKNDNEVKARWLYFYLSSPQAQKLIKERLRGTTQQYLPLGEIRKFPILRPNSNHVMENLVQILGCLEDKIELNTQTNQTLEQIAQAIFK
ncbi:Type I restriction-modification system, specificity subunit S, partial [Olavius algarvensis spirochete endosymbiont]|uniref:restriction endonuclease subunit S n=1 Tax=Olavius algarvensis spirochete endosymbiont TaxID=260710 RepID=UPI000F0F19FC